MRRREQINGKDKPEEVMLFKFRKQPRSVYFKWIGPAGNGREAIWVDGQHESKLHTLLAAARAGVGVAVLPRFLGRHEDVLEAVSDNVGENDVWLITHPEFRRGL